MSDRGQGLSQAPAAEVTLEPVQRPWGGTSAECVTLVSCSLVHHVAVQWSSSARKKSSPGGWKDLRLSPSLGLGEERKGRETCIQEFSFVYKERS